RVGGLLPSMIKAKAEEIQGVDSGETAPGVVGRMGRPPSSPAPLRGNHAVIRSRFHASPPDARATIPVKDVIRKPPALRVPRSAAEQPQRKQACQRAILKAGRERWSFLTPSPVTFVLRRPRDSSCLRPARCLSPSSPTFVSKRSRLRR